jgi:hypothetical protein
MGDASASVVADLAPEGAVQAALAESDAPESVISPSEIA